MGEVSQTDNKHDLTAASLRKNPMMAVKSLEETLKEVLLANVSCLRLSATICYAK